MYHRLAELVSSWTEHPASPFLCALVMHSVFLPLPLPTVHHFCAWWRSSSPPALNINAVVIAEYSLVCLCRGRTLITARLCEPWVELSPLLALPLCSQHRYATLPPQHRLCGLAHALSHVLDRALVAVKFAAAARSSSACCWRGWRALGAFWSRVCFDSMLNPAPIAVASA